MGRIRTIKPEFPQSETIGRLSRDARLLFIQLWTVVDDEGRARAASRMLASILYPYDDDAPSLIGAWLEELEREGCVVRYAYEGTNYVEISNWSKHQKVDHRTASRFPPPPDVLASPREPSRSLAPDLGPRTVDLGSRIKEDAALNARDKTSLDQLQVDLRSAAGLENESYPGLLDLSPILGLTDAGYDVESEILPVLRAKRRKGIRSWSYFVPMVHEARDTRMAAASGRPNARAGPSSPRPTRGIASALAGVEAFHSSRDRES